MTLQTDDLGGRLPLADPATLTDTQRGLFDLMMNTMVPWANQVPFQSTTVDGRLIGPFNPAPLNPATATKFLELQFAEQLNSSLDEQVRQVIVLTVGAIWAPITSSTPTPPSPDRPACPSRQSVPWSLAGFRASSPSGSGWHSVSRGNSAWTTGWTTNCTAKPKILSAHWV